MSTRTDRRTQRAQARLAAARKAQVAHRRQLAIWWGTALACVAGVIALVAFVTVNSPDDKAAAPKNPAMDKKPAVTAGTGDLTELKVTTLVQGSGPAVTSGQSLSVHYVGVSFKTGAEFDSSWSRGEPFEFTVGQGSVITGWDQGLIGVKVGSRVQLDIPSAMAYGDDASGGRPAGPLRFVVDVLSAS